MSQNRPTGLPVIVGGRAPRALVNGPLSWAWIICALLLAAIACEQARAEPYPRPTGWVSDFAKVMDAGTKVRLESVLTELRRKTGAEVAVVTLPKVTDGDVETAAVDLLQQWGIGQKGKDNGALILCAVEDRRIRIEVGYGLEGILPDAKTGRIIDEQILPLFRAGDLGEGLTRGALTVASVIAADAGVTLTAPARPPSRRSRARSRGSSLMSLVMFGVMALLFIMNPRLFLLFMLMGGGRGYGGYGRGGFGGSMSGFGGFGGGLSGGGGASRGW